MLGTEHTCRWQLRKTSPIIVATSRSMRVCSSHAVVEMQSVASQVRYTASVDVFGARVHITIAIPPQTYILLCVALQKQIVHWGGAWANRRSTDPRVIANHSHVMAGSTATKRIIEFS